MNVIVSGPTEHIENPALRAALEHSGLTLRYDLVDLDKEKDPIRLIRDLRDRGAERLLVCGGDGTIHNIAQIVLAWPRAERPAIGIIPMGTANDFANAAGVTDGGLEAAVQTALKGKPSQVDAGWMNGRAFVNVASGGHVAKNTTEAAKGLKSVLGRFAYYVNALARAPELCAYDLTVTGDGWTIEQPAVAFAVANSSLAGGGFKVAPYAKVNDGELDLLLIPQQGLVKLAALAAELLKEEPSLAQHEVFYRRASEFKLSSKQDLQVNLDGEPVEGREFHFKVEPRALDIIRSV